MKSIFSCLLVAVVLMGCEYREHQDMNKEQIFKVVEEHIKERFPRSVDVLDRKSIWIETETYWEVTFEMPELTLGGVPIVRVSKDSGEVIYSIHTQ